MNKVARVLACLACARHGRRLQTSIQQLQSSSVDVGKNYAGILSVLKPAAAFTSSSWGRGPLASLCSRGSQSRSHACLSSAAASATSSTLEVWSFNLRTEFKDEADGVNGWSKRRVAVADFIGKRRPALICVQEATEPMLRFLVDCLGLQEYAWVGTSRTPDQMDETAGFIYDLRRLSLQEHHACWYGPPNATPGVAYWDAAFPRTCEDATFHILNVADTRCKLRVLNTHLDHVGVEARRRSAELLAAEVQKRADDASVLAQIVCGDFNSPKGGGNDVYKVLTAKGTGLVDIFRELPPPSMPLSTIHKFEGIQFAATAGDGSVDFQGVGEADDARHIDWILWRSGPDGPSSPDSIRPRPVESCIITDCLESGLYPSDHFPMSVKFALDDVVRD